MHSAEPLCLTWRGIRCSLGAGEVVMASGKTETRNPGGAYLEAYAIPPRQESWQVTEERRAGTMVARMQSCIWADPNRSRLLSNAHRLILTLSPLPLHRTACLSDDDNPVHFVEVGDIVFMPAHMPLHGLGSGGSQRVIELRVQHGAIANLLRQFETWDQARLQKCLDIRSPALRRCMLELARELQQPDRLASSLVIEGLATSAFVHTARFLTERDSEESAPLPAWMLDRIKQRIGLKDELPPSVTELAELCGLSRRHLLRQFRATTGDTVQDYLASAKYERAGALLMQTDLPIKTIAYQLGFASPASFTSSFVRVAGIAPRKFRDNARRNTQELMTDKGRVEPALAG